MSSTGSQLSGLPRGPHSLTASEVRESQRARLIDAMLELVGSHGWTGTTVPKVVARARVSRNAFYDLFDDKLDCYLAAVDVEIAELLVALRPPPGVADWRAGLDHAMGVYVRHWQERPGRARAYLVEAPNEPRVWEQRQRTYDVFCANFAGLGALMRRSVDGLPPLRDVAVRTAVVAVTDAVEREVRAGRLDRLGAKRDELTWLVVRLLGSDELAG